RGLLRRRDHGTRAAVPYAEGDVLRAQRHRPWNDERPELERTDERRMPRRHPRQHDDDGITPPHTEARQRVHHPVRSALHVPERQAGGATGFVLPVERDPGAVGRPGVHHLAEVELGRYLPPEVAHEVVVATSRGDHAALRSPRRAETWMYLREI